MRYRRVLVAAALLLVCVAAHAKNKKKFLLPNEVLQARTVLVLVDPEAGVALDDPNANRIARADVQNAFREWGRYAEALNETSADLIVVVRKGSGKMAQATVAGVPINNPPGSTQPPDPRADSPGAGSNAPFGDGSRQSGPMQGPHPRMEVGSSEDLFAVYLGNRDNPLDSAAIWSYVATDGLESPEVPAVVKFRKLVLEVEQQAAKP
jgi:hypothetical protein